MLRNLNDFSFMKCIYLLKYLSECTYFFFANDGFHFVSNTQLTSSLYINISDRFSSRLKCAISARDRLISKLSINLTPMNL